jgi:hypothetical protein
VYGGSPNGYGLEGQSANYPLVLKNSAGTVVFDVDAAGNIAYSGGLKSLSLKPGAGQAATFSARTTRETIEDTGTGRLVNGTAVIALDSAFSSTIDRAAKYRVFVTPDGETHELYVATKTISSFTVREAQGGRSTVDFDYRIVASAAEESGGRKSVARGIEPRPARVPGITLAQPPSRGHAVMPRL